VPRIFWCALLFGASCATAQEFSYDGNRWYDVEVSIFTNDLPGGTRAEIAVASKLNAAYLPRLRELQTRATAFAIEFPQDSLMLPTATNGTPFSAPITPVIEEAPLVTMGPVYSPAVRDGFKITDFDRDSFVDLGTRAAKFAGINRNIDGASEHRLLWHKVWRQPMQGRAQTPAVFISGGDIHAAHTELEGSLRLSDNAGGVMLDINVWLNAFTLVPTGLPSEWKIPEFPFQLPSSEPELVPAELVEVWQLAQTRELGAGQLYYLDHPALGVLIEIRPYVLPERIVVNDEEDF
jgi:hypothetical protein